MDAAGPVSSWSVTALAWTGPTSRVASSVSHHLPPLGRLLPANGHLARRLPARHSSVAASPLRCRTGLAVGRSTSGRPPSWCPQVDAGYVRRLVGTATPLRRHREAAFRASAHLSRVLVEAGVTPAEHSHGPAPLAPVVPLIVRVRTVGWVRPRGRPLTLPSGIASPRGSLACLLSEVHAVGAVDFQTRSGQQAARPVGSGALRIRTRITRPGSTSRTRGHTSGRPHRVPLARLCAAVLPANVLSLRHLRCGCRPHCPYTVRSLCT